MRRRVFWALPTRISVTLRRGRSWVLRLMAPHMLVVWGSLQLHALRRGVWLLLMCPFLWLRGPTTDALHACLVGGWTSALLYRRPFMSILQKVYSYEKICQPQTGIVKIFIFSIIYLFCYPGGSGVGFHYIIIAHSCDPGNYGWAWCVVFIILSCFCCYYPVGYGMVLTFLLLHPKEWP